LVPGAPASLQGDEHDHISHLLAKGPPVINFRSEGPRFGAARQVAEQGLVDRGAGTDTTAGGVHIANQREALLREFLRWQEQFSFSHKQPPQATEEAFAEFMRSLGKR
jgi:hypothetical protein